MDSIRNKKVKMKDRENKRIEFRYLVAPHSIRREGNKNILSLSRTTLSGFSHMQKAEDTGQVVEEIEFDLLLKVQIASFYK